VNTNGVCFQLTGVARDHIVSDNRFRGKSGATGVTAVLDGSASKTNVYANNEETGIVTRRRWATPWVTDGDRGANNVTLFAGIDAPVQEFTTDLPSDHVIAVSTTGAVVGDMFSIIKRCGGAGNLDVNGILNLQSYTKARLDLRYTGAAWVIVGYQDLYGPLAATNDLPNTSGATLGALETEVNLLKAALRTAKILV
jgi:hypothetical protein